MKDNRLVEMRVFLAVLDSGGFTAASAALGTSQSFVSQTLGRLEERLGTRLLHRSTRGHRITEEGRAFGEKCRAVIELMERTEADVSHANARVSGHLSVNAPLAFGIDQVTTLIPSFLAAHPELTLTLSLSDTYVNLIEENVDVAIRMGSLKDSALVSRRLCTLQRVVVASPSYLSRHGQPRTPSDLDGLNCLLWHGSRDHLNRWPFIENGALERRTVTGSVRSSNGLTLVQLCLDGVGVMRMAEHLACPLIAQGRLVPLLEEYAAPDDTAFHAVFMPERRLVPRIRAFVDHLADAFRTPPWTRPDPPRRAR